MRARSRAVGDELTEDLLSAYADGELDAATRARVEARLADDESWRAVLEEIEETRALLRGVAVREAPSGFWSGVHDAVSADADEADRPEPVAVTPLRSRRRTRWSIAAGVAAAAVVVAMIVVPTPTRSRPPVATMVDTHAARASLTGEPVSTLSPMGDAPRVGR
jgi:anti-sigma factor RsiW